MEIAEAKEIFSRWLDKNERWMAALAERAPDADVADLLGNWLKTSCGWPGSLAEKSEGDVERDIGAALRGLMDSGLLPSVTDPAKFDEAVAFLRGEAKKKQSAQEAEFAEFARRAPTREIKKRAKADPLFAKWLAGQTKTEAEYKEQMQEVFNPPVDARSEQPGLPPLLVPDRLAHFVCVNGDGFLAEPLPPAGVVQDISGRKLAKDAKAAHKFDRMSAARAAHRLISLGVRAWVTDSRGRRVWPSR